MGAALILGILIPLLLRAAQSGPPAVAEFAPQAQHPITQSESEQTSQFGSGPGGPGGAQASPSPSRQAGLPAGAVVLHCVGDPPRQIEDPQSPPCVPFWQGDNGGATSKGVSRTSINIFVPWDDNTQNNAAELPAVNAFQRFFNAHFELYGRQLNLEPNYSANSLPMQAAAEEADKQYHAFASTYYNNGGGGNYYPPLAQHGIIGAGTQGESEYGEATMAAYAPYIWQYSMSADQDFANMADWVCSRLKGGKAAHAGDPSMHGRPRLFAVVHDPFPKGNMADEWPISPLMQGLQSCGIAPAFVYDGGSTQDGKDPSANENLVLQLRTHNITSVICMCNWSSYSQMQRDAQGEGYEPEWLISSYGDADEEAFLKFAPALAAGATQFPGMFGITFRPRQVAPKNDPFYWALTEEGLNDSFSQDFVHSWFRRNLYHSLLMLASGIQMAGPQLSPQTFASSLNRAVFPNPPYFTMPGKVGFNGNRHSMTLDGAEWWWSDTAKSPFAGDSSGTFCYVDGGARHTYGNWPKGGDPFFQGACDSGFEAT